MPTFLGPFENADIPKEIFMKNVVLLENTITFSMESGSFNLGDVVLTGTVVIQVLVKIKEGFNGNSSISVGTNFNPTEYVREIDLDISEPGSYFFPILQELITASQLKVFFTKHGSTSGEAEVFALVTS